MDEVNENVNPVPSQCQLPTSASTSTQPTAPFSAASTSASNSTRVPEHLMYKNRLQEYTQRESLPLPVYRTVSEGFPHDPRFRSTVIVDGKEYTCQNTFMHRKEAEQEVAKLALASITENIKDGGCTLIPKDTILCKSILNEYAAKMQLEKPTYRTFRSQGLLPVFLSSLVFNGVTYTTSDTGRNKKESEQLAARATILSLLGNADSGGIISKIIKSKRKLRTALPEVDSQNAQHSNNIVPTSAIPQVASVMHPPHHEFTKRKQEPVSEAVDLPVAFTHSVLGQSIDFVPGSGKKRRNKKKANKKIRTESLAPINAVPLSQVASHPVA